MEKVPPEVWEKLFEYINISKDMLSVSRTIPVWKNVVDCSRSKWMFGLVFPFLLKHLSKSDVLHCRAVCRKWLRGVDHFLFNNHVHRPGLQALELEGSSNSQIDAYHGSLYSTLHKLDLLHTDLDFELEPHLFFKLLDTNEPNVRPFVLRSVILRDNDTVHHINREFVQAFGVQIWFMRLILENSPPDFSFAAVLDLLRYIPNLKKLALQAHLVAEGEGVDAMHREFENLLKLFRVKSFEFFPKLETLNVTIRGPCRYHFMELLLTLFCNENLLSLKMCPMTNLCHFKPWNLVDLSMKDYFDLQLKTLDVSAPVQTLRLYSNNENNAGNVFKVVQHFKATLRHVSLTFVPPSFYSIDSTITPSENLMDHFLPFMDTKALDGVLNVKTFEVVGVSPGSMVSFNFIMGLRHSLEHLILNVGDMDNRFYFVDAVIPWRYQKTEVLDLYWCLRFRKYDKFEMYKSNIWTVFPKLKLLTVYDVFYDAHINYRRDNFEKFKENDRDRTTSLKGCCALV